MITLESIDPKRDDRQCPHCAGSGFSGRDTDQDGDFGLPCRACFTSGAATYCPACALAGAEPTSHIEAAYELGWGTHWRRTCVRSECVGDAVTELRALALQATRPGLAHTRPEALKESSAC